MRSEGAAMSQEVLFFLFMIVELCAILLLYQLVIIPKIALKTNNLFEQRMMDKSWDIPAMLEDYTGELIQQVDFLLFGFADPDNLDKNGNPKHKKGKLQLYFRDLMGGYMSGGIKQLKADPDNAIAVATSEYLEELPLPAQLVARSLLPKLQAALTKAPPEVKEAIVEYSPGLSKQ